MTWIEAVEAMKKGKWVRRESWDTTWLIRLEDNHGETIIRDTGFMLTGDFFWDDFVINDVFATDWEDMG